MEVLEMRIHMQSISKNLIVFLSAIILLFGGCSQNSDDSIYSKMVRLIGTEELSETAQTIGVSEDEWDEQNYNGIKIYAISDCNDILPLEEEINSSSCSVDIIDENVCMVKITATVLNDDSDLLNEEVYKACTQEIESISKLYSTSAFSDYYEGVQVDGETPKSFSELYKNKEDFLNAAGNVTPESPMTASEMWWTDSSKKILVTFSVRLTVGGAVFTWSTEDYSTVQAYYAGQLNEN